MAYLGRGLDKISNIEVLDNITFDGSSSYSITKGSVAFTPNSAQSLLISIDGVVQATNFTVSSSTIDFGVAIPSTSVCNFFLHYGTGVMTVPSDGSVTTAKLGSNAVSSAKMFSGFKNGITEIDAWYITTSYTASGVDDITTNLARVNYGGFNKLGTGMTESSGIFTFPSTGIWKIEFIAQYQDNNTDSRSIWNYINTTTDNSSYYVASGHGTFLNRINSSTHYVNSTSIFIFDVTDTSTHKVKFSAGASGIGIRGDTNSATQMQFIRLGDT